MWIKYVTRRLAVQVAQAWNFGWAEAMQKVYGVSVKNTLVFRDAKKTDYYVDQRQHEKYVAGLYKLLKNDKFIDSFHKDAQTKLEGILKNTRKKFKQDFTSLSNKDLLDLYRDFLLPNQTQFYIRMWTVFNIGQPLANVVRKNLERYVTDKSRITEYLLNLSSPLEPNNVLNERIDILKLALVKKLNRKTLEQRIIRHTGRYQHIPMFDFDHEPYSVEYFSKELKAIKNPKKELAELQKLFRDHIKEFKLIVKELKPDRQFRKLLEFLKENVFLRDYRDMLRQKLNLELRKIYHEIGVRLGLSIEEVAILTNDEIVKYLKIDKKFPQSEVKKRNAAYLLIQKGNKVEIYSGNKALMKAKKELAAETSILANEVKGVVGSKGKAIGQAKIVYTNKDLAKVKEGDILVATMTRQDFVPAMRKAAAIVTDEGSVTAHAAIIARELRIPCVVATKKATQVFRDGDKIEVNVQDDGTVRVIERVKVKM
jgi:phosphohistidine swiveling domain-containing protein